MDYTLFPSNWVLSGLVQKHSVTERGLHDMKKVSVCLVLVLLVSLAACAKKQPVNVGVHEPPRQTIDNAVTYRMAQELGDAVVAHYLGREYPAEYAAPLVSLKTLGKDTERIYFDTAVELDINQKISEAALISMRLPGSPVYRAPAVTADDEASGGNQFNEDNSAVMTQIDNFTRKVFPDGTAPAVAPLDANGMITNGFRSWFLSRAVEIGMLDGRIRFDEELRPYVLSGECSKSQGGLVFKVFDATYELQSDAIGVITEDTKTLPVYDLIRTSHMYFDTGWYRAVYKTDPNAGADDSVTLVVYYRYRPVTAEDADFQTDLDRFLAGVVGVEANVERGQ